MTDAEFAIAMAREKAEPDRRSCELLVEILRSALVALRREMSGMNAKSRAAFRRIYRREASDLLSAVRHFRMLGG